MLALDNLLLTPHVGGWSPDSVEAQFTIYQQNLDGHFSGRAWSRRFDAGHQPLRATMYGRRSLPPSAWFRRQDLEPGGGRCRSSAEALNAPA